MRKLATKSILLGATGLLLLLSTKIVSTTPDHPHHIAKNQVSTSCTNCHNNEPENQTSELLSTKNKQLDPTAFKQDGIEMCSSCHNPDDGHPVKLEMDFDVPADMPVGKKNTITCLTCHFTHGDLNSERPQASFSFMDRLVDAKRLHKSFLLRRNNTDGELCLICHTVKEGSK